MKLSFTVKSLGKKRPLLDRIVIDLDLQPESSTQQLLEKIVAQQVEAYNLRKEDSNLIDFFQEETLDNNAKTGSVKFNEHYNRTVADKEKATSTVLQAFEDGLIAFFVNDRQLEDLNELVCLREDDAITILRLTFLAGSIW